MFKSKNLLIFLTLSILFTAAVSTLVAQEGSGSAKFVVTKTLFIAGNEIKPGSYSVKWESKGSEAIVVFVDHGKQAAKMPAKLIGVDQKTDFDKVTISKDSAGHEAVKDIQFEGKKAKIVFE
jgi:hypothetical protein